jgi:phage-related protein
MKAIDWVGSTKADLDKLPEDVQHEFGYALYLAQVGDKHEDAKPLAGFGGAGVLEVVENYDGDTYRAVYTVRFSTAVYVLHVFQKKSKKGIKTPKRDIDLIKSRLRLAEQDDKEKRNG